MKCRDRAVLHKCCRKNSSKFTPLDCKIKQGLNILALFADLPNCPVKYAIYVENNEITVADLGGIQGCE